MRDTTGTQSITDNNSNSMRVIYTEKMTVSPRTRVTIIKENRHKARRKDLPLTTLQQPAHNIACSNVIYYRTRLRYRISSNRSLRLVLQTRRLLEPPGSPMKFVFKTPIFLALYWLLQSETSSLFGRLGAIIAYRYVIRHNDSSMYH